MHSVVLDIFEIIGVVVVEFVMYVFGRVLIVVEARIVATVVIFVELGGQVVVVFVVTVDVVVFEVVGVVVGVVVVVVLVVVAVVVVVVVVVVLVVVSVAVVVVVVMIVVVDVVTVVEVGASILKLMSFFNVE